MKTTPEHARDTVHKCNLCDGTGADPLSPVTETDLVCVPREPTEAMWGGLARAIVMWTRFDRPSEKSLLNHLKSTGEVIPSWLALECRDVDHVPPKGSVAVWIYRAMLDAAPPARHAQQPASPVTADVSAVRKVTEKVGDIVRELLDCGFDEAIELIDALTKERDAAQAALLGTGSTPDEALRKAMAVTSTDGGGA